MALGQSPITLADFAEGLNGNLPTIERDIFDKQVREYDQIAKIEPYRKWVDERQAVQGLTPPRAARDLEPIPQVAPVKGYKSVIRQQNYKHGITVEETAVRNLLHKEILDNVADGIESIKTLKDTVVLDLVNNGFTDSLSTNITEFDGTARAPFSTGHYYENGTNTWSNYYNVGVAPTPEVVFLIINALKRLKDFSGNFINLGDDFTIFTPTLTPAYGMAAEEIVQSMDKPTTADRATNIVRNRFKLSHVALNNLTSTTKWFIGIKTSARSYPLILLESLPQDVSPLTPLTGGGNPDAMYMRFRTQFGPGWNKSYRGLHAIGT
jgi:hypothetical protein